MSEIKTWQERCLERGIGSCEARDEELIELRAALTDANTAYDTVKKDCWNLTEKVIPNLRAALAERDAKGKTMIDFKLQATGIPESIEQYQLALDAAFNAGKAIAAGAAPTPTGKVRLNGITC